MALRVLLMAIEVFQVTSENVVALLQDALEELQPRFVGNSPRLSAIRSKIRFAIEEVLGEGLRAPMTERDQRTEALLRG